MFLFCSFFSYEISNPLVNVFMLCFRNTVTTLGKPQIGKWLTNFLHSEKYWEMEVVGPCFYQHILSSSQIYKASTLILASCLSGSFASKFKVQQVLSHPLHRNYIFVNITVVDVWQSSLSKWIIMGEHCIEDWSHY